MSRPVVFHVPHSSAAIPPKDREHILLGEEQLEAELLRMTDWYTDDLFREAAQECLTVRFPVSRLVLDPERFEDDSAELMASRGMGVIYTKTASGERLREAPDPSLREEVINKYYRSHHAILTRAVEGFLVDHGMAMIVDCHSFPSRPLPYEINQSLDRPEICIGTDEYHTPSELRETSCRVFKREGFTVDVNKPFAGALVPLKFYQKNRAISSIMIEVRRDLYMNEATGDRQPGFPDLARRLATATQSILYG